MATSCRVAAAAYLSKAAALPKIDSYTAPRMPKVFSWLSRLLTKDVRVMVGPGETVGALGTIHAGLDAAVNNIPTVIEYFASIEGVDVVVGRDRCR